MAQFICKLTPVRLEMLTVGPSDRESEIVSQHFDYWSSLAEQDVAILLGRTQTADENTFGIAIFNANSIYHAQQPYRIAILNPQVKE